MDPSVLIASVHCNDMVSAEKKGKVFGCVFVVGGREPRLGALMHGPCGAAGGAGTQGRSAHAGGGAPVLRQVHAHRQGVLHREASVSAPGVGQRMRSCVSDCDLLRIPVMLMTAAPHCRWLSSQQALADLAEFHSQIIANYSLTTNNKWVAFGGSYPGMMAGAWPCHESRPAGSKARCSGSEFCRLLPAQVSAPRARRRVLLFAVAGQGALPVAAQHQEPH